MDVIPNPQPDEGRGSEAGVASRAAGADRACRGAAMSEKALTVRGQDYGIAELTRAEQLLATVEAIPDAKKIADAADALRMYMKKADLGLANQNRAAAIATKARRKAGEIGRGLERKLGMRTDKPCPADQARLTPLQAIRNESGISRQTMDEWQLLSKEHTDADIDAAAAEATANGREFTTGEMLKRKKALEMLAKIEVEINAPFAGFDFYLAEVQQELTRNYPDPAAAFVGTPIKMRAKNRGELVEWLFRWFHGLQRAYEIARLEEIQRSTP